MGSDDSPQGIERRNLALRDLLKLASDVGLADELVALAEKHVRRDEPGLIRVDNEQALHDGLRELACRWKLDQPWIVATLRDLMPHSTDAVPISEIIRADSARQESAGHL